MSAIRDRIDQSKTERRESAKAPIFAPGGQSTQMIVGRDRDLRRGHPCSRLAPVRTAGSPASLLFRFQSDPRFVRKLPLIAPPLIREHRLYQADWLMRFYGFQVDEITPTATANLDLDIDPKLGWALRHRQHFPVDLNRAPRPALLRVPGLGVKTVDLIIQARRWHKSAARSHSAQSFVEKNHAVHRDRRPHPKRSRLGR